MGVKAVLGLWRKIDEIGIVREARLDHDARRVTTESGQRRHIFQLRLRRYISSSGTIKNFSSPRPFVLLAPITPDDKQ